MGVPKRATWGQLVVPAAAQRYRWADHESCCPGVGRGVAACPSRKNSGKNFRDMPVERTRGAALVTKRKREGPSIGSHTDYPQQPASPKITYVGRPEEAAYVC